RGRGAVRSGRSPRARAGAPRRTGGADRDAGFARRPRADGSWTGRCARGGRMTAVEVRSAAVAKPPRRDGRRRREVLTLILPALLPVLVFSVGPLLYGIYLAFTDAEAGVNHETS